MVAISANEDNIRYSGYSPLELDSISKMAYCYERTFHLHSRSNDQNKSGFLNTRRIELCSKIATWHNKIGRSRNLRSSSESQQNTSSPGDILLCKVSELVSHSKIVRIDRGDSAICCSILSQTRPFKFDAYYLNYPFHLQPITSPAAIKCRFFG